MATRWQPDTCRCIIEYDGVDETTGALINPVRIKTCRKHADLEGAALAERLLDHNRLKNRIIAEAIERGANPRTVAVRYDPQDGIVISGTGWSPTKIANVTAALNSRFPNRQFLIES